MKKAVLLTIILTAANLAYSQGVYTMPIETARKLVADAMRARIQDSMIVAMQTRITQLEEEKARQWADFNKLLDIEHEKFQAATEINLHLSAINDHYREENKHLKRQNRFLKIGVGVAFVSGVLLAR